jgi:hypothetical protein
MVRLYWLVLAQCLCCSIVDGAIVRAEWKHSQSISLSRSGLVKLSIPLETLTALRPGFEDLRLLGPDGREIPYAIQKPKLLPEQAIYSAPDFGVELSTSKTILTFTIEGDRFAENIWLDTPEREFVKAASLEGSSDGNKWTVLARGLPVFRHPSGQHSNLIPVPAGLWKNLRIIIDDQRSRPIPITGVRIYSRAQKQPSEAFPVSIAGRADEPRQTKLFLQFGGANVVLASLDLSVADPLFKRKLTLLNESFANNQIRRTAISRDTIQRENTQLTNAVERYEALAGTTLPAASAQLIIENDDSPPLAITGISARRLPVFLLFIAPTSGSCELLSGNEQCMAPVYDIAELNFPANNAFFVAPLPGPLVVNTNFISTDPLAAARMLGGPLEPAGWSFRKPLLLSTDSVQQLEIDLDVLAHSEESLDDLRLIRQGMQMPFILDRGYLLRTFPPAMTKVDDPKRPQLSRWKLLLPKSGIPISTLTCTTAAPFFHRVARVVAEQRDETGEIQSLTLGTGDWSKNLDQAPVKLAMSFAVPRAAQAIFLELENGDNAALDIQNVELWYPASRLIFKAAPGAAAYLYYGNEHSIAPQYDLQLLGPRLLQASKTSVLLGKEEILKPLSPKPTEIKATWFFWTILAIVVIGLLFVIARLLPAPKPLS